MLQAEGSLCFLNSAE